MKIRITFFCNDREKFKAPNSIFQTLIDQPPFDVSVEMEKLILWGPQIGQWKERRFLKFVESMEKGEMR